MSSSPTTIAHSTDGTRVRLESAQARWTADLDAPLGGAGHDPDPHQLLDSALAACTTMTLQLYARRKAYPLGEVEVRISHVEEGGVYRIHREVVLGGALNDAQRADLLRVANVCPIHKALTGRFEIETELQAPAGDAA